ncbi:hypothetical protein FB451DRAFT_1169557 [Mycena latifolia]|nr:hypothetical protein FB451DRAFT_1169557 [Mycena latifolia]
MTFAVQGWGLGGSTGSSSGKSNASMGEGQIEKSAVVPGQAVLLQRHTSLYFRDGTLTLKTHDGTLYNVYRQQLILKSDLFGGMLTLPIPGHTAAPLSESSKEWMERAWTARVMPQRWKSRRGSVQRSATSSLSLSSISFRGLTTPRTCDFFGVESGMKYAIHHLEDHPDLGPALRYKLASDFGIERWAKRAFYELMSESILEISNTDEVLLGWPAYRALVRTHAEVAHHRLTLALFPPEVVHANFCYDNQYCANHWAENWVGMSGVVGTLLKDELSGAEMHDALSGMQVPGMTGECCLLTITSIQDTPAAKSLLRKEEEYIDNAVEALIKDW